MTEAERKRAAPRVQRIADEEARRSAPKVKITQTGPETITFGAPDEMNPTVWKMDLLAAFGTIEPEFASRTLVQLTTAVGGGKMLPESRCNAILASMSALEPRDEIEAMLISQMIATQEAAMDLMRQMNGTQLRHQFEGSGNLAVKMLRTFTAQVETLKRLRSKGEQRVVVQHQHVQVTAENAAVQVNPPAPGGGGGQEIRNEQPHEYAKPSAISFAPSTPMRSADTPADRVPMPCRSRAAAL
jgi:hypothetical protein